MKEFDYTIKDPNGIHARPAGILVKTAKACSSTITVVKGEKSCDMKKILVLMGMGIKQGDTIHVKVEGADEEAASKAVFECLAANF